MNCNDGEKKMRTVKECTALINNASKGKYVLGWRDAPPAYGIGYLAAIDIYGTADFVQTFLAPTRQEAANDAANWLVTSAPSTLRVKK